MTITMGYATILDAIGNTPLVELRNLSSNPRVRIFAKLEGQNPTGSLKDRIAHYMSKERTQLLHAFGAQVVYSDGARGTNGAIALAQRMAEEDHHYYMPYQYGNENNPRAHYETTGVEILRDLPDLDVFVAGLGAGGRLSWGGGRRTADKPK